MSGTVYELVEVMNKFNKERKKWRGQTTRSMMKNAAYYAAIALACAIDAGAYDGAKSSWGDNGIRYLIEAINDAIEEKHPHLRHRHAEGIAAETAQVIAWCRNKDFPWGGDIYNGVPYMQK